MIPPVFFSPTPTAIRHRIARLCLTTCLTTLLTLGLSSPAAHAQTYTEQVIHSFSGTSSDGSFPTSDLTNINGLLYGATFQGGPANEGTIFFLDPVTQGIHYIYSFQLDNNDGFFPNGGLLEMGGTLYGTTNGGGIVSDGTVFSINPDGTNEQILHSFTGNTAPIDGQFPHAGLTLLNGIFYTTAQFGGSSNDGMVAAINPSTHAETIIHTFTGTNGDGASPLAGLIAVNGILYGTTTSGGTHNKGTVFAIDPSTETETTLHSFSGGSDGDTPYAGLTAVNGLLYGSTNYGGTSNKGILFAIDPTSHQEQILYHFGSGIDGANPQASLAVINGLLYGTTAEGGAQNQGTVFTFDPSSHAETVVYSFGTNGSSDGNLPQSSLLALGNTLYGTTSDGGTSGEGTLFSLTISASAPVARSDSGRTYYNTTVVIPSPGVLANDDNGGSPMTADLVTKPSHGTITFKSDGSFTYLPNTGYLGTDSFTYQAVNSVGKSNVATCTLAVQPKTPTAKNDSNTFKYNTTLAIPAPGVLNDDDSGGSSPMTASLVTGTAHGTVTLSSNGGYKYTPNAGYVGNDSFTYQAVNAIGKSNVATVTLIFQAVVPTANNDAGRCQHNTTLTITAPGVLGNDSTGGSTTTAVLVTKPSHGTITFKSDGSFVYKPTTGFIGTDSFTYQDTNAVGTSNTATCTLTVQ